MGFVKEYFELMLVAQLTIIMIFGYLISRIVFSEFDKANGYGQAAINVGDMHTEKLLEIEKGIDILSDRIEGFEATSRG